MSEADTTAVPSPAQDRPYEFTDAQNQVIGRLAISMRGVSAFIMAYGLIELFRGLAPLLRIFTDGNYSFTIYLHGIIFLLLGIWMRRAAWLFQAIVNTEDKDINHLMNALDNLSKACRLTTLLILIAILFTVLVGILWIVFRLGQTGQMSGLS